MERYAQNKTVKLFFVFGMGFLTGSMRWYGKLNLGWGCLSNLTMKSSCYVFSESGMGVKKSVGFFTIKLLTVFIVVIFTLFYSIINPWQVYATVSQPTSVNVESSGMNVNVVTVSTGTVSNTGTAGYDISELLGIEAESFILIDSRTGIVLLSDGMDKKHIYPASTTKIMAAIVALENESLDTVMTASQAAVYDIGEGGMNIGIMAGEELTLRDLLHAMLICSANEAANIIAENVASSREEFINMMNERAKELGATDTNFVNANGLHHENHYTTAKDMAIIARHAMTIPAFREIVRKDSFDIPPTNKHKAWDPLYTTNRFLRYGTSPDCNFEIIGIKTGYTSAAGHNLVTAAVDENGMELISVILGVKTPRAWEDVYKYTEKLLKYGFDNFSLKKLIDESEHVTTVSVENAKDSLTLDLVTDQSVIGILPKTTADLSENINITENINMINMNGTNSKDELEVFNSSNWNVVRKVHLKPLISAPISEGEILGYIEFFLGDTVIGTANLIAANSIEKKVSLYERLKNSLIFNIIRTTVIVLASFMFLRIILRKISRKVNARKRKTVYRYNKRLY